MEVFMREPQSSRNFRKVSQAYTVRVEQRNIILPVRLEGMELLVYVIEGILILFMHFLDYYLKMVCTTNPSIPSPGVNDASQSGRYPHWATPLGDSSS